MKRLMICICAAVMFIAAATSAFAGPDLEFGSRYHALAGTGNAAFNPRGMSPMLENIACLAFNPDFNILAEMTANSANSIKTVDDIDYYTRFIDATMGLKTTFPILERHDPDDFTGRLVLGFTPGTIIDNYYLMESMDSDNEISETITRISAFQRFGAAYGIQEYIAVGLGITAFSVNFERVSHDGTWEGVDVMDNWNMIAPAFVQGELGVLGRPVEFIQIGFTFESGGMASYQDKVTHDYADDSEKVKSEVIFARSPSIGLGFAIDVPDIEKFYISFDYDQEFGYSKDTEYAYYSDPQKQTFSAAIEKGWEISSIKGGLGYSDEVALEKFMPRDSFFMTFGTDFYFDEHLMIGFSFRADAGYIEGDYSSFAFGGGTAATFGGRF